MHSVGPAGIRREQGVSVTSLLEELREARLRPGGLLRVDATEAGGGGAAPLLLGLDEQLQLGARERGERHARLQVSYVAVAVGVTAENRRFVVARRLRHHRPRGGGDGRRRLHADKMEHIGSERPLELSVERRGRGEIEV